MDIAYGRFTSDVIKVIQDISESHFVAFDLEFSGVAARSQRPTAGKPTLQEHYDDIRLAAARYQILQVGLTVVKEDLENGQYIVKPYNFNISPLPTLREKVFTRDWSMSSGAVQFLLRNRFDFSLPLATGIPYLSRAEEVQARMNLSGETDRRKPDMILKADDEILVRHIRHSITKWQELPEENRENYLNIPDDDRGKGVPGALNRYQLRLTHQIVQNEFPHLKTTGLQSFVQITNPTQEERERQKSFQQKEIDREVGRAVGFRWILEAIAGKDISGMPDECFLSAMSEFPQTHSDLNPFRAFVNNLNQNLSRKRRVLVGHNCLTDLVYLHRFFIGELPERVEDFQDSIHELFPAVVDTKNVASYGSGRWGDTSLQTVEEDLREETEPRIVIPSEFDRYTSDEKPHEAGYDALLTANIAIKLSAKMEREGTYYNQESDEGITTIPVPLHPEPFGSKEEGYVTAPEDIDSQISETGPRTPITVGNNFISSKAPEDMSTKSVKNTPGQSTLQDAVADSSSLVAVKDKKSRPGNWNSAAEVEKVKSVFAATNIYDVLDQNSTSGEEDLISFSAPNSPARPVELSEIGIDEIVKQGKLMPRWDGGNGFWQVFGNKLQVNSCKEGVCNL